MTSLKEKVPLIGIGLAAIAVAGYLFFSGGSKKAVTKPLKYEE